MFLSNTGKYTHKDIRLIFEKLYNGKHSRYIICNWQNSNRRSQKLSNIFVAHQKDLAEYLYNLWFYQAFVDSGVDEAPCKRFKEYLEAFGVKVHEENNAVIGMKLAQGNNNLELIKDNVNC